jgi:uncharacterized damage-inducible protein DinB
MRASSDRPARKADDGAALARGIAAAFREHMLEEYVPRIRRCTEMLSAEQVWQRPAPACNSIGNLLLHLTGNVRQWILAGLGGARDERDRPAEFATAGAGQPSATDMVDELEAVVREAARVVDDLRPEDLLAHVPFQGGQFGRSALAGVVHVLEHFSGHAGQIYALTKQMTGRDLRFYDL